MHEFVAEPDALYVLAGQLAHDTSDETVQARVSWPGPHLPAAGEHVSHTAPRLLASVEKVEPATHGVQADAPAADHVPAGHARHSAAALAPGLAE